MTYGLNCVSPKVHVEALILNVMIFGDKTFREILKAQ